MKDEVPGLDVHALNISGCGAAHWAGATGNIDVCKWLFRNGFDLSVVNHANHGLVNSAAYKVLIPVDHSHRGLRALVLYLTPLLWSFQGHTEVAKWAVAAEDGPQLWEQLLLKDHGGVTLIMNCRSAGHVELADWLDVIVTAKAGRAGRK